MYKMLLRKEKLRTISRENLEIFFHLIRIDNALRSLMKMQVKLPQSDDNLEKFKDSMDLYFFNIGLFYEGVKKFFSSIYPRIPRSYISEANLKAIESLKNRFENCENDDFLQVTKIIRDKVAFHFDLEVVSHNISDGEPKGDILIGYVKSKAIYDCIFLEPYTAIFTYIANRCPNNLDDQNAIDWIRDTAIKEVDSFCKILEQILNGFFKRIGKLVEGNIK